MTSHLNSKNRRVESPEVRQQQILDAARELFVSLGYSNVALDEVARRAGLAKGTLYLHFKDKEHLYAALMANLINASEARIKSVIEDPKLTPLQRLRRVVEQMLIFFDENRDAISQCSQVSPSLKGKHASDIVKARFKEHMEFLSGVTQEAVKSGDLRKHDPFTGAQFIISLVRMFMMRKIMNGGKPLRNYTDDVMDLFINGLGSGK